MKQIIPILLIIFVSTLLLYPGELKKLTFEQVYMNKGETLLKSLPRTLGWADDRSYYELRQHQLFKVDARSGKSLLVMDGSKYMEFVMKGFNLMRPDDRSEDFRRFLLVNKGDIFLLDTNQKEKEKILTQLTHTKETEQNPTFSPDGTKVAYTMDGNLYVYHITGEKAKQLTKDGSENILNGYASWVYYEEILGRRGRHKAFWWSPDSRKLVFMRFDQSEVPIFPIFNAAGTYGHLEKQRYPKPGFPNPQVKIGIADVETGGVAWLSFQDKNDHYLAFPRWNKKSTAVYIQWLNRDQSHLSILRWDLAEKIFTSVYEEKQKTWVDFLEGGDLELLENGDLLLRSSKSGWFHIYYVSKNGNIRPVTSGDWTVSNIESVNERKKQIYFSARKEDSTEEHLYRTDFYGKKIKKLTTQPGWHYVNVSPGGSYFIDSYSTISFPTRMELKNRNGKLVRKLGDSYSPVMETYDLAKRELFRIKTGDGYELPATWLLPPGFDKNKKYPVVFTIYGGPGASAVRNAYTFRRSFRFHFLAQQGIIVLSVDHRGSGHFGKIGENLMHRNFGKWEMHDYIEAVKYLRTLPFVDSQRIGITGGSYGGYVTALALTSGADYFQYGIAGSPVIDWALYDSVYTERYMDTPQDNPEGYKKASVLGYMEKYKNGTLLMTHGAIDDNVHMQNTIQFIEKVLDANKTMELMLYPDERHSIRKRRAINAKIALDFWLRKFFNKKFEK